MYAVYTYNAGATAANILADVVKLLTGTTNVADLSASCNQAMSLIVATEPAGWTVYDAAAGANAVCLTSPVYNNSAQLKYIVIDTNTAGTIFTKVYESWNATTHAGTNPSNMSTTAAANQRVDTTLGGRLDIRATNRCCVIFSTYQGTSGFTIGSSTYGAASGVVEHIRNAYWDTIANAYPNYAFMTFSGSVVNNMTYTPRMLGSVAETDITGSSSRYSVLCTGYEAMQVGIGSIGPNYSQYLPALANKRYTNAIYRMAIGNFQGIHGGGEISSLCGIYYGNFLGYTFNKIFVGTQAYIAWTSGTGANMYKFYIKYA